MSDNPMEKNRNEYPPSTELIPDEYDVVDGRQCVHIFCPKPFVANCEQLLKALNINLKDGHKQYIHEMDSFREVEKTLNKVAKTPQKDKSLLLLIFWGYYQVNGEFILDNGDSLAFYKIWSIFCTSHWRNTPKLFFLNVIKSESNVYRDSFKKEFETPNEGDILIVFKKNIDVPEAIEYFINLKEAIEEHGKKEDICSIVTAVQVAGTRPVLIFTMLKKLYLLPSEHRGHHFLFSSCGGLINEEMRKINFLIQSLRREHCVQMDSTEEMNAAEHGGSRRSSHRSLPEHAGPRRSIGNINCPISWIQRRKSSVNKKGLCSILWRRDK